MHVGYKIMRKNVDGQWPASGEKRWTILGQRSLYRCCYKSWLLVHLFPRLPEAVILLVLIKSPMYFCRNLLLLSSLSCSSRTASIRLNIEMRESCRAFACLIQRIR